MAHNNLNPWGALLAMLPMPMDRFFSPSHIWNHNVVPLHAQQLIPPLRIRTEDHINKQARNRTAISNPANLLVITTRTLRVRFPALATTRSLGIIPTQGATQMRMRSRTGALLVTMRGVTTTILGQKAPAVVLQPVTLYRHYADTLVAGARCSLTGVSANGGSGVAMNICEPRY
jgi:hypothetical protein